MNVRAHLLSSMSLADFIVTLPSTVVASLIHNESNTKILASPRLRAAEGKKTSLKIGTEVPVPEPSSLGLLLAGIVATRVLRRRNT